jgi:hypothetical protein
MYALDVLKDAEQDHETDPDQAEGAHEMFLRCVQYKEVEDTVQSDGEDNSGEGIEALLAMRLVKREAERHSDDRG